MKKEEPKNERSAEFYRKEDQNLNSTKIKSNEIPFDNKTAEKLLLHQLEVHQIELEMQNDELRQAQFNLEVYSKKYFELYDLAPYGYLTFDEKGTILELNLTMATLLAESRAALINKNINSFITHNDRDIFYLHMGKMQKTKSTKSCELKFMKKDGTEFYGKMIGSPVLEENTDILKFRVAIIDITERKRIEDGLERTRQELAVIKLSADEVSEFAENLIDTVREPLLVLDQDLRVIKASRSFYDFFNVSSDETIGTLIYNLGNKQWNIPKLRELLETILPEKTTFDNYEVEHDFNTIGKRIMLLNARQIERAFGKDKLILLAIEDITERKRADDEIKFSKERLKTINMTLRHDLTNDLAVIKSAIRLYNLQSDSKMLEEIEKRVEKSLTTINRLREQESYVNSHTSLSEYKIAEVLKTFIKNYPALEIKIEGEGTVFADEGIYSVFENLINNAINHGKTKKLKISISSSENYCEIRFTDYGEGIPAEIMPKVFEEGFIYGETGHTGIGLYIVRKIINEYDGKIYCEANNPSGVTFVINLRKSI